jgi:hypothetical protein
MTANFAILFMSVALLSSTNRVFANDCCSWDRSTVLAIYSYQIDAACYPVEETVLAGCQPNGASYSELDMNKQRTLTKYVDHTPVVVTEVSTLLVKMDQPPEELVCDLVGGKVQRARIHSPPRDASSRRLPSVREVEVENGQVGLDQTYTIQLEWTLLHRSPGGPCPKIDSRAAQLNH